MLFEAPWLEVEISIWPVLLQPSANAFIQHVNISPKLCLTFFSILLVPQHNGLCYGKSCGHSARMALVCEFPKLY